MSAPENHKEWLALVLADAYILELMTPDEIIQFATPEVMANHLPPEVMSKVLAASLKGGTMSPEVIVETTSFEVMAEHIPSDILWNAVRSGGDKTRSRSDADEQRVKWMTTMLAEGLRLELFDPEWIVGYVTPEVLAAELPRRLVTAVLEAGLQDGRFSPELIVGTLEPKNLAEHIPFALLWRCVADKNDGHYLGKASKPDAAVADEATTTAGPGKGNGEQTVEPDDTDKEPFLDESEVEDQLGAFLSNSVSRETHEITEVTDDMTEEIPDELAELAEAEIDEIEMVADEPRTPPLPPPGGKKAR